MKSSAGKIALTGLNDLFQTSGEMVQEVPLSELFPFKNHPFQVIPIWQRTVPTSGCSFAGLRIPLGSNMARKNFESYAGLRNI